MEHLNLELVSKWMASAIVETAPPFEFTVLPGGRSNLTLKVVDANGHAMVLRRPPEGTLLHTAHDVLREARILSALRPTAVPVPAILGVCPGDREEGPFYVMEWIEGVVLDSAERARALPPQLREAAARNLVDVLADLHAVDIDRVGLGTLSKRDGYVPRQIARWSRQWSESQTRDLALIDTLAVELMDKVPTQPETVLTHGDYRFGNCLTNVADGTINAVLDWELSTLGDPLADLGYLLAFWFDGTHDDMAANDPTPAGGFGTRSDVIERYASRTGRDVAAIDYYVAFSCWRMAVIAEGVYARHASRPSDSHDLDLELWRSKAPLHAEQARAALTRLNRPGP